MRSLPQMLKPPVRYALVLLVFGSLCRAEQGQQQFASLGDFKLVSGEVVRDCRIGYRTLGQLNRDGSNAILVPTWFGGVTQRMLDLAGPGKLADSSKYFVVLVDALGNGVSTSPSNSKLQPRRKFPQIAIRDMVNSQYQLLTQVLHIHHLEAVMGISMGGMQTFQWMVSYPNFMDKAVPIVGSPRLAAYDLLLWQTQIDMVREDANWKNGDYTEQPARTALAEMGELMLTTPEHYNRETTRQQVGDRIAMNAKNASFDANDRIRQAQAMMALDISQDFGGSMEKAASAVRAKALVIVSATDQMVTPGPAKDFARLLGAELWELHDDCGHWATVCEDANITARVGAFLER